MFLLVGLLIVDTTDYAACGDRRTVSDDYSTFTLTLSEIFKKPLHRLISILFFHDQYYRHYRNGLTVNTDSVKGRSM